MQADQLLAEKREIESLVQEKVQIEGKLVAAGGKQYSFLLQDCEDLADMIDEISEVSSKRDKKKYAAIDVKVKFSRKVRRKAKDLNNFEKHLVQEYDNKHITLEHGRKMAEIIKLLRSSNAEEAKSEAAQFYRLLEMGKRLLIVNELLLKKRAQAERAKRSLSMQLSDLEWLEKGPQPDMEKAGRHIEMMKHGEKLAEIRLSCIRALQSMPLEELLAKISKERLDKLGFPEISTQGAESLAAFLQKAGLKEKTSRQLYDISGQNEKRLQHIGIDLAGFRAVIEQKHFLRQVMNLHSTDFLPISDLAVLAYLSKQSQEAKAAAGRFIELGKTAEEDSGEWERTKKIGQMKEKLAGIEKAALEKSLHELKGLQAVLDGKAEPAATPSKEKKEEGIIKSIMEFFKSK